MVLSIAVGYGEGNGGQRHLDIMTELYSIVNNNLRSSRS